MTEGLSFDYEVTFLFDRLENGVKHSATTSPEGVAGGIR
jgi:hypothetical protein